MSIAGRKIIRLRDGDAAPFYAELTGQGTCRRLDAPPAEDGRPRGKEFGYQAADLLSPVEPPDIFCVGLNYRDHAEENSLPAPAQPVLFMKASAALNGPGAPIVLPAACPQQVDYEAELVVVIGREARNVPEEQAAEYILGYTCGNDVSARDAQFATVEKQWMRGKSFDGFAPLGPCLLLSRAEPRFPIVCRVNGEELQRSHTANLIHGVYKLVSYISRGITLKRGAVIFTGTPGGVGHFRRPPRYLRAGDVVEVDIDGVGLLRNPVVAG